MDEMNSRSPSIRNSTPEEIKQTLIESYASMNNDERHKILEDYFKLLVLDNPELEGLEGIMKRVKMRKLSEYYFAKLAQLVGKKLQLMAIINEHIVRINYHLGFADPQMRFYISLNQERIKNTLEIYLLEFSGLEDKDKIVLLHMLFETLSFTKDDYTNCFVFYCKHILSLTEYFNSAVVRDLIYVVAGSYEIAFEIVLEVFNIPYFPNKG